MLQGHFLSKTYLLTVLSISHTNVSVNLYLKNFAIT